MQITYENKKEIILKLNKLVDKYKDKLGYNLYWYKMPFEKYNMNSYHIYHWIVCYYLRIFAFEVERIFMLPKCWKNKIKSKKSFFVYSKTQTIDLLEGYKFHIQEVIMPVIIERIQLFNKDIYDYEMELTNLMELIFSQLIGCEVEGLHDWIRQKGYIYNDLQITTAKDFYEYFERKNNNE